MSRENFVFHEHIQKKKKLTTFDVIVTIASFLYPLSSIYQVIQIFEGSTAGVSIYSWLSFALFSVIFLAYGLKHHITPMIITNSIWLIMDSLVVIGILLNS